ncbi:MAG: hypothetical protein EZS28_029003 [Streblomastix strix]|uniref:Uncharacterized protein n=1 Tax=Streblomastix strix TaxID=222440 RepID=A0A5J4UZ19_9EUKA|nr:MAG: hypothetical protein EZS28_029003 [Streblomastix strix]
MTLQIANSFGATLGPNTVAIIDERHVLYLCGKFICVYQLSQGEVGTANSTQTFIRGSSDGKQIKSICTSPQSSRVRGIAFTEQESQSRTQITVIPDWTNPSRRIKSPLTVDGQAVIALSFSGDSRYLCALSRLSSNEYTLYIWQIEHSKMTCKQLAALRIQNSGPLTHACFHLLDSSTIYACGAGFFRVFKLQDQSVKSIPGAFGNKNLKNYTHMCWLTTQLTMNSAGI